MKTFLNGIKTRLTDKKALAFQGCELAYWLGTLLYLELLIGLVVFKGPDVKFLYTLGFSLVFAAGISVLTSLLRGKWNFAVKLILTLLVTVLYGSQLVYNYVFGGLYSVALVGQGGAAITSFWKETVQTILDHWAVILSLLVPMAVLILLQLLKKKKEAPRGNWVWRAAVLLLAVLAHFGTFHCVSLGGSGYFTDLYFYNSNETTTTQAAQRFGVITAMRLELMAKEQEQPDYLDTAQPQPEQNTGAETENVEYNILPLDFDALNQQTDEEKIRAINNYCATLTGTNKNEYTGMLHDYNLIVLCAESFDTGAIHPEYTPTLYKLANEGILFKNYYNTYPSVTTDGEYALCMGLYPDSSRTKVDCSFYVGRNNYVPFTLGKVFSEQAGIQPYAYHNYLGSFYGREETYPNMGYKALFATDGTVAGMRFSTLWPSSDYEMMKQAAEEFLTEDQFHAYMMTFSGHYKYDRFSNPMAERNYLDVVYSEYSEPVKCYLSCNIELDKALSYLMEKLEEAGVAEKTAIVIAGDHYPYGLTDEEYAELVGEPLDAFNKFKSSLIFWVGGLEENIVVEEYCCNVDILPTILNLWGFRYDSRMLAGTDVFSDGIHIATLVDKSFFTDKVWFNANTGEVRYLVPEEEVPEGYIENMIRLIQNRYTVSANILNTAYFNFIFEKGDVNMEDSAWTTWDQFLGGTPEVTPETPEEGEDTDTPGEGEDTDTPGEGGNTGTPGTGGNPGGGQTPPEGGETPPEGGETPPEGGETPPEGGETPPEGGETPPEGGETPPEGGETPPEGGETPPEGGETPPGGGGETSQQPPANPDPAPPAAEGEG